MNKKTLNVFGTIAIFLLSISNVNGQGRYNAFYSDGFWDNSEMNIGAGVSDYEAGIKDFINGKSGVQTNRLNPALEISFTKWITVYLGLRGQVQGYKTTSIYPQTNLNIDWNYIYPHIDVLINSTNLIALYDENRVYNFILLGGVGLFMNNTELSTVTSNYSFAINAGINNSFSISKSIGLNLECKALLLKENKEITQSQGFATLISITVGFSYKFQSTNKFKFKRRGKYRSGW
jgi:hypothetical protein